MSKVPLQLALALFSQANSTLSFFRVTSESVSQAWGAERSGT